MTHGYFITFEGGEGAGKSTQIRRLAERLRARSRDVVLTREPGGSPGAEEIRALLLNGEPDRWSPLTEALLMNASRRDHIERVIAPALERGAVVLCDRFADSTRAYQGAGGQVDPAVIGQLEAAVVGETKPDLTLIFDLPVEEGLRRALSRNGGEERFEAKGSAFHERLRAAYLDIARTEPERCVVVDATETLDAVEGAIWTAVAPRLGL
ncbi:MAG TPA: dTMP kinase [Caulobacter sp.]|nr:dTMP kinase [Caulobacter sp.]